jgi:hypothetical protein
MTASDMAQLAALLPPNWMVVFVDAWMTPEQAAPFRPPPFA